MPKQKCFLICNAHLDPVWLWPWEEGLTEAISTFWVAADFLDEYPEFVFNHNESLLYEWVERNDPELFERIRKHVAGGRWHPAGGAYLQPDLIATSGESAIRQFLIGKRYFAETFGAEIIVRRSDDHYITQGEIRRQMLGTAVQGNENDLENDTRPGSWPDHYREAEGDFMFLWGVGNHGGGATRQEYAQFAGMRADFPSVEFVESTTDAFFEHTLKKRGRDSLPVSAGDFNQIHEGCYTFMFRVKQAHRAMENMMHLTEKLCAMAWWQGKKAYPAKDLEVA